MNILICSQYGENQVTEVSAQLRQLGANPVLFERYRKDQFISYHYNKKISACLRTAEEEYPLTSKTFPVVWYRPKPIILSEIPGEAAKIKEKFCIQEWRSILYSLDIFLSGSKWVNPILESQRASNKAYQLCLAMHLGLTIPQTVITNDALKTIELFADNRVIYKTLSCFFTAKEAIYTNEITAEQVLQRKDEISMAPGIFQKYIDKRYELRVTVIGEKICTVKINSQHSEKGKLDWRKHPDPKLYDEGELSKETSRKLLTLHRRLGLVYAAYDFIVDTEGNEIFLECNPSGQWLWLDKAGMQVSSAMAKELISY